MTWHPLDGEVRDEIQIGDKTWKVELPPDGINLKLVTQAFQRALIEAALDRTKGNKVHAARLLQTSLRNLRNHVNRWGIQERDLKRGIESKRMETGDNG